MSNRLASNLGPGDYLNVTDAAHVLGCSRRTVNRWVDSKKIIATIVGGYIVISKEEVDRVKKDLREAAIEKATS